MLVTAKFNLHPQLPNRKSNGLFLCMDLIYYKNGYIKHANHLPLNLQMGNMLLGTTMHFLIMVVKMFYIFSYAIIVTTFILEKVSILKKEYISKNQM